MIQKENYTKEYIENLCKEKKTDITILERNIYALGLLEALKNQGLTKENVSMKGLGYKEILDYLDGKTSLEEAVYIIKRDTRHFAKRQLTWIRREKKVNTKHLLMIHDKLYLKENQ